MVDFAHHAAASEEKMTRSPSLLRKTVVWVFRRDPRCSERVLMLLFDGNDPRNLHTDCTSSVCKQTLAMLLSNGGYTGQTSHTFFINTHVGTPDQLFLLKYCKCAALFLESQ